MDSGARSTTRARKTLASSKICERECWPRGLAGAGGDLDEAELADDGFGAADLVDVDGDFEFVERGLDAMGGGLWCLADDGHAGGVGALGFADRQGDDVDVKAAEERGDSGEDAGFVAYESYEGVEHSASISGLLEVGWLLPDLQGVQWRGWLPRGRLF